MQAEAKTLRQKEVLSELEATMQTEAQGFCRRQAEAEEIFKREADELCRIHAKAEASLFQTVEDLHRQNAVLAEDAVHTEAEEVQRWRCQARALSDELHASRISGSASSARPEATFFQQHSSVPLSDIASTTVVGRSVFQGQREAATNAQPLSAFTGGMVAASEVSRSIVQSQEATASFQHHPHFLTGDMDISSDASRSFMQAQALQSPLSASSPWVENNWGSPQDVPNRYAGTIAPPVTPAGYQAALPSESQAQKAPTGHISGEEQFIRRCGELTRQQEAFIAKMKANPDIGPDELREELKRDAQGNSHDTSSLSKSSDENAWPWHDASVPLTDESSPSKVHSDELLGAFQEAPAGHPSARSGSRDWHDASLPLFVEHPGEDVMETSDVVRRRLSFGVGSGTNFWHVPNIPLAPACTDGAVVDRMYSNGTESQQRSKGKRRVSFELTDDDIMKRSESKHASSAISKRSALSQSENSSWREDGLRIAGTTAEFGHISGTCEEDVEASEDSPSMVWRWHTWSPGDLPPAGFEDDCDLHSLQTVDVQVAQETQPTNVAPTRLDRLLEDEEERTRRDKDATVAALRQSLIDGLPEFSSGLVPPSVPDSGDDWQEPLSDPMAEPMFIMDASETSATLTARPGENANNSRTDKCIEIATSAMAPMEISTPMETSSAGIARAPRQVASGAPAGAPELFNRGEISSAVISSPGTGDSVSDVLARLHSLTNGLQQKL
jgi:hypothetical protein